MKRIAVTLLAFVLAGCFIPVDESGKPSPGPDKPNPTPGIAQSVWSALADRIDKGKIRDTDELLAIVRDMKAADDIADTKSFEDAFPTMAGANVILDSPEKRKQISDKLRELK